MPYLHRSLNVLADQTVAATVFIYIYIYYKFAKLKAQAQNEATR